MAVGAPFFARHSQVIRAYPAWPRHMENVLCWAVNALVLAATERDVWLVALIPHTWYTSGFPILGLQLRTQHNPSTGAADINLRNKWAQNWQCLFHQCTSKAIPSSKLQCCWTDTAFQLKSHRVCFVVWYFLVFTPSLEVVGSVKLAYSAYSGKENHPSKANSNMETRHGLKLERGIRSIHCGVTNQASCQEPWKKMRRALTLSKTLAETG